MLHIIFITNNENRHSEPWILVHDLLALMPKLHVNTARFQEGRFKYLVELECLEDFLILLILQSILRITTRDTHVDNCIAEDKPAIETLGELDAINLFTINGGELVSYNVLTGIDEFFDIEDVAICCFLFFIEVNDYFFQTGEKTFVFFIPRTFLQSFLE